MPARNQPSKHERGREGNKDTSWRKKRSDAITRHDPRENFRDMELEELETLVATLFQNIVYVLEVIEEKGVQTS